MLEEAGEVLENMLKASCLPLGFIVFLPAVLLLVAPPLPAADAAHEFTVYRMQQYDLQGQPYGTRNAVLNTEARTIDADVLSRRCVLMRLLDFSYEQYQKALRQSAGAVVIILPRAMAAVPQDVIRQFMETEPEMLAMETVVPVYFAVEDEALLSIYEQTQAASAAQGSASAAEVLLHTATANGFQMVTSGVQSKAVSDWLITSVEGRLTGLGGEDLPTIVIVAHYDAFGVAPWLSHGADSNGSGISVLLELARLFSRLYTYKRTHAAYVTAGREGPRTPPGVTAPRSPRAPGLELSPTQVLHPRDTGSRLGPSGTEWVGPGMPLAPHGARVAPQSVHGAGTGTPCSEGSGLSACGRPAPPRGPGLPSTADTRSPHAARYNLLFFASGGGKFNYQGTKRWLEDNLDHTDSSLLQDNVAFVLCLDTVGRGDSLHLHVSKPPREGTLQHAFLRELETVAAHQFPEVRFSMVHKKINLAEDILAWEHERFAIRRLPAFTLSHLESHRDGQRSSIMDVRSRVDSKTLTRNTRLVAEALTRVIYNLTDKGTPPDMPVFTEQMIQQEQLDSVMDWLTNQPRAAQLVDKDGTFLSTLEHYLSRYLKEVKQHHIKADKRDPEFVFYDQLKQVMNAYRVKPAIFDLLLAVCIGAYLGMAYTAVQHFDLLYRTVQRLLVKAKAQ
ncbi:nicalin isoform X2 [Panthera uncia]|uniref:nicalin isoform X2 n=1 Tax=Panthera uncia TaxID=29064 RepID=UPI0020FF9B2D|nr:nicalin isoform X2 [Panthera uncia]